MALSRARCAQIVAYQCRSPYLSTQKIPVSMGGSYELVQAYEAFAETEGVIDPEQPLPL